MLYELLTGRPPIVRPTLAATLMAITADAPLSPRAHNPQVSLDLETICLKCLEKDPSKRYPTAELLADDLQRFLNNEPISARPITRAAKLVRWSQRNPALATAYSLLILIFILILIASPLAAFRINEARKAEAAEALRARRSEYAADMLLAGEAWAVKNLGRTRQILQKHSPKNSGQDLRGWEWRYLWNETRSDELFTLSTNSDAIRSIAWSPDRSLIASVSTKRLKGNSSELEVWDVSTRSRRQTFIVPGRPRDVRFLANGEIFVTSDSQDQSSIYVWNSTSQTAKVIAPKGNSLGAIVLNADATVVAATGKDWLAAWDVRTGSEISHVEQPALIVSNNRALALSPDGKYIAYNSFVGTPANSSVVLVDGKTGARLARFQAIEVTSFASLFRETVKSWPPPVSMERPFSGTLKPMQPKPELVLILPE
ncbi:MAG: hypothetical protein L0Z50_20405 [Verrucomicrobiales bacterium]|nr:hypothetical protein [Verrucomicrobiales bacterium]